MKHYLYALFVVAHFMAAAQSIPQNRVYDWNEAGLNSVLPDYATTIDITQHGAIPNDGIDDFPAIQSALAAASGPSVLFFPAGTFLLKEKVEVPSEIIFRGAGSDNTTLQFHIDGHSRDCFDVTTEPDTLFQNITGGLNKGSLAITVGNSAAFSANDYLEIRQDNGSWNTQPASYAENSVGQIVQVVAVIGNTVVIDQPLRIGFDLSLNPVVRKLEMVEGVGFEDFTIERLDTPTVDIGYNFNFNFVAKSWIVGVESFKSSGAHVMVEYSRDIEITGNYFHHAFDYSGAATKGYGICLRQHTSSCLVQNNIFQHLRHAMMVKEGSNGNVFGYNYSFNPYQSQNPHDGGADISVHGHYPFANLFEGNVVQTIFIDQFWGPAGPHNTFVRNWAQLYGILMSQGTVESDSQSFVGNEVTNVNTNYGNYLLSGNGHVNISNNWRGLVIPPGSSPNGDDSYYLSSTPDFWSLCSDYPVIGNPGSFGLRNNPALERWNSGSKPTIGRNENPAYLPMETNLSAQSPLMPGGSDGAAQVTINGGEPTLSYGWSNGGTAALQTQLSAGTYFVSIIDGNGCQLTDSVEVPTACGLPHGTFTSHVSTNSAKLRWSPISGIHHYKIRAKESTSSTFTRFTIAPTDSFKNLMGLASGKEYQWQIQTYCNSDESSRSGWSSVETFLTGCHVPTSLASPAISSFAAQLLWDRVAGAEGYELSIKPTSGNQWTTILLNGTIDQKNVFGLQPGTSYDWKIKTICDWGQGVNSIFSDIQQFSTISSARLSNLSAFDLKSIVESEDKFEIFDASGRKISNDQVWKEKSLSPGIYFVKFLTESGEQKVGKIFFTADN